MRWLDFSSLSAVGAHAFTMKTLLKLPRPATFPGYRGPDGWVNSKLVAFIMDKFPFSGATSYDTNAPIAVQFLGLSAVGPSVSGVSQEVLQIVGPDLDTRKSAGKFSINPDIVAALVVNPVHPNITSICVADESAKTLVELSKSGVNVVGTIEEVAKRLGYEFAS